MKYIELNAARNIVNIDVIDEYINTYIDDYEIEKPEIIKWLKNQCKSYIINKLDSVKPLTSFKKNDPDWLKKSVKEGTALLVDLNNQKFNQEVNHIVDYFDYMENKELSKIYKITFEIAVQKSKDWTKELNKKSIIADSKGEYIIREYPNGVTWKILLTPDALKREGKRMHNCVGTYDKKVLSGKSKIYSLRDSKDIPQCTIEQVRSTIRQIKGMYDGWVEEEYVKYVENFLYKPIDRPYTKIKDLCNLGKIEIKGKEYKITNLPSGLIIEHDLNLFGSRDFELPTNLTIKGSLNLLGSGLTKLPDGLKAGSIVAYGGRGSGISALEVIGDNVEIMNSDFEATNPLSIIGKNFKVSGNVVLNNCNIEKIGEGLEVGGDLTIIGGEVLVFSNNVTVKNNCIFHSTEIKKLPENFSIGNTLEFYDTDVSELPKTLTAKFLKYSGEEKLINPNNIQPPPRSRGRI